MTLFSILADVNIAVVWRVSTCPVISNSASPSSNPSLIVPRAPITIVITFTFIFHGFFQVPDLIEVLIFLSVLRCGQPGRQSLLFGKFSFFVVDNF